MLTHDEIMKMHDENYVANQTTRDKSSLEMFFYWVSQWDENILTESTLTYKGQFDLCRKVGRDLIGNLRSAQFDVDFSPKNTDRGDDAEIVDGLYRASLRSNESIEAFNNCAQEFAVCGNGAWELYTEYETNILGEDKQVLRRRPLYEANNKVFWDANSQLLDNAEAMSCSVIDSFSERGYKAEVAKIKGISPDEVEVSNYATPNQSYVFPWVRSTSNFYLGRFYHIEIKREKNYVLSSPFEDQLIVRDFEFDKAADEFLDAGFEIIEEIPIDRRA